MTPEERLLEILRQSPELYDLAEALIFCYLQNPDNPEEAAQEVMARFGYA